MGDTVSTFYDKKYRQKHYFKYREWLYRPFVRALVRKAKLKAGSNVLDVGCGQGFFSRVFADFGLKVVGVDFSSEAIRSAQAEYGFSGARFETGDVLSLKYQGQYDCVFARGLSLYNTKEFVRAREVTEVLLGYLKPSGVMIFTFPACLCSRKKSESWIFPSLPDVKEHFSRYPGAEVHFSLRIETLLLGTMAFSLPVRYLAAHISQTTGIGGEIIAFVPRSSLAVNGNPLI